MNRYGITQNIKNDNNISRKSTVIYPNNPIDLQNDIYIRTTTADRLDKLALNFYDDASKWWIIASANGLGKGTLIIPQNTRIRIPDRNIIQQVINEINNSR